MIDPISIGLFCGTALWLVILSFCKVGDWDMHVHVNKEIREERERVNNLIGELDVEKYSESAREKVEEYLNTAIFPWKYSSETNSDLLKKEYAKHIYNQLLPELEKEVNTLINQEELLDDIVKRLKSKQVK